MNEKHTSGRLLRLPAVRDLVPVSRAQLYRMCRDQKFPAPVHIAGGRISFWHQDEVLAWLANNTSRVPDGAPATK
jgi:predicted DNA-binding transcriptional regulator AlpA